MKAPVAYIRRSVASRADPGDISREFQADKVRELAGDDASHLLVIDSDWGKSGGRKSAHLRAGFTDLLARIERGEVSTVYAYSADRLARDVEASARLLNVCERTGTVLNVGGMVADPAQRDTYRFMRQMLHQQAVMNEAVLDEMERKAQAAADKVRQRTGQVNPATGQVYESVGRKPYGHDPNFPEESVQVILDAYEKGKNYTKTARILNSAGVKTRLGGPWDHSTVKKVVERAKPSAIRNRPRIGGRKVAARRMFTGMLLCHCGRTMVTDATPNGPRYICRRGIQVKSHPRPYSVRERVVAEWAHAQLDHMRQLDSMPKEVDDDTLVAELAELDRRQARWIEQYAEGLIDRDERNKRLALIGEERERIETTREIAKQGFGYLVVKPVVDWEADPDKVNDALGTVWKAIQMGPDMKPFRAIWHPTEDWSEFGPAPLADVTEEAE